MSIEWTEDLATGIAQIDAQHRELYQAVARLHTAMREHHLDQVAGVLDFLQGYAVDHFALEEGEMQRAGYPGLAAHRQAHVDFVEAFLGHRAQLRAGTSVSAVIALSGWLGQWLREHVRSVDGEMARHLRAAGRAGAVKGLGQPASGPVSPASHAR